jgi:hypothetical protein
MVFSILSAVEDSGPACSQECWGRVWLALIAAIGFVTWELGAFAGLARRVFRDRRFRRAA